MTKDQKVTQVTGIVNEARRFYTKTEFAQMIDAVWNGFDQARNVAQESVPTVTRDIVKPEEQRK